MSLLSVPPTQDPLAGARFPHRSPPAGGLRIPRCTRLPPAPVAAVGDEKHAEKQRLGPLLTSRPRDIPLGSAEIVEFAGVGKGKGLGTGSSYEQLC